MNSPFPGMGPYLERHWRDVHAALIISARAILNQRLPDDLIARAEERVAVEAGPRDPSFGDHRDLSSDVRVFEAVEQTRPSVADGDIALAPYRLELLDEPITERFIEIIDIRGGERLVTVIEFVSPSNKIGDGLKAFIAKRNELLAGGVNFVEIDLVRAGQWRALLQPYACPAKAISTYSAVMRVPGPPAEAYLHPISLREPLPVVKIPLRAKEPPCELPLQTLVSDAYLNGRYGRTIDYRQPCEPAFDAADAEWVAELLRAAGLRG